MGEDLVKIVAEVFGLLENIHIHCSLERVVGGGCIDSVLWAFHPRSLLNQSNVLNVSMYLFAPFYSLSNPSCVRG